MLLKTNVCVKPCKPIKNTNILSYIEIMYLYLCCAQNYLTEKYQVMKHSTLNTQHSTGLLKIKSIRFSLIVFIMVGFLSFLSSCEQGGNEQENLNSRFDPGNSCYDEVVTSTCIEDTTVFVLDGIPSFPGCEISLSLIYCFDDFGTLKYVATGNFELISTC